MYAYYNTATGNIVGMTGYEAPRNDAGITAIPDGADAFIWLTDDANVWGNHAEYKIQNGAAVYTPLPDATKLAYAQNAQINVIEQGFANAMQTFQSSALGVTKTYLLDPTSWAMLAAEYSFVTGPDSGSESSINWFTVEDNAKVPHTNAQIKQVFLDGRAWVKNQEAHKDAQIANIKAVTLNGQTLQQAEAAVYAFTW